MQQYQTQSISLRYDIKQDRIQWINHHDGEHLISLAVTRRMLMDILPKCADWINQQSTLQVDGMAAKASTPKEKQQIHQFEHELAQQYVPVANDVLSTHQKIEDSFLLNTLQLSMLPTGNVKLTLMDEQKEVQIISIISLAELHKIMGELVRLSEQAVWGIANPWYQNTTHGYRLSNELMH